MAKKKSSSSRHKRRRREPIEISRRDLMNRYNNPEEREQRLAASTSMDWTTKRRALVVVFVLGGMIGLGFLVNHFTKTSGTQPGSENLVGKQGPPIVSLKLDKQQQCYQDADCPDGTYCGRRNYCIPSEMEPPLETDIVLGRGRGGEGSNVYLSSFDRKGQ